MGSMRLRLYDLSVTFWPDMEGVDAVARMAFSFPMQPSEISFLLNPGLQVTKISTNGAPMDFTDTVVNVEGTAAKARQISIGGLDSLSDEIIVSYGGRIESAQPLCPYVKDTISAEFTLFRWESLCYPLFAKPSIASLVQTIQKSNFQYSLKVFVPANITVASPGMLSEAVDLEKGKLFIHNSSLPSEQLAFAAAQYNVLHRDQISLYLLADSICSPQTLLYELKRCQDFLQGYLGVQRTAGGLKVIEIPQGYGSFAGPGFVFQDSSSIQDPGKIHELYHECAHTVAAVKTRDVVQRSRFFDEALAQFLAAKAVNNLRDLDEYLRLLNLWLDLFRQAVRDEQKIASIPIAAYGYHELGGLNYYVGPLVLVMLEKIIGEELFARLMGEFIMAHTEIPATFESFRACFEGDTRAQTFIDACIFGTKIVDLLTTNSGNGFPGVIGAV